MVSCVNGWLSRAWRVFGGAVAVLASVYFAYAGSSKDGKAEVVSVLVALAESALRSQIGPVALASARAVGVEIILEPLGANVVDVTSKALLGRALLRFADDGSCKVEIR